VRERLAHVVVVDVAPAERVVREQVLIELGFWPRLTVVHTSARMEGQIYIPEMNWLLMVGCIAVVLQFRSSSGLAAAYGIAVTGTMAITSILFYLVCRRRWASRRARRWRSWSRS
jgi:KUP system potassium uptake protein